MNSKNLFEDLSKFTTDELKEDLAAINDYLDSICCFTESEQEEFGFYPKKEYVDIWASAGIRLKGKLIERELESRTDLIDNF